MGDKENVGGATQGGHKYDAKSIKVLGGLEPVRLRPAMYMGATGEMRLDHLVWGGVDNSGDEALACFADEINVTVHPADPVALVETAPAIPLDVHATEQPAA